MSSVLQKKRPLSHVFESYRETRVDFPMPYGVKKRPIDVSTLSPEIRALVHKTRARIDKAPNSGVKEREQYLYRLQSHCDEGTDVNLFPSMDMCSHNTQNLIYFSGDEDLLYYEGPIIYKWEDGTWDCGFHSWATRTDGTRVDLTYDFDYIPLDTYTLSSCPVKTKRLIRRWMESPERAHAGFIKAMKRGRKSRALDFFEEGVCWNFNSFIVPTNHWDPVSLVRMIADKGNELGSEVLCYEAVCRMSKGLVWLNEHIENNYLNVLGEALQQLHNEKIISIDHYKINTPLRAKVMNHFSAHLVPTANSAGGVR